MIINERIKEVETAIQELQYFKDFVNHDSFYDEFFDIAIRSMKKEKKSIDNVKRIIKTCSNRKDG